jgi:MOSC domain-containing protein YiiM
MADTQDLKSCGLKSRAGSIPAPGTTTLKERKLQIKGEIVAVCLGKPGDLWKFPVPEVELGPFGIVGDRHYGPTRRSYKDPTKEKPNDREISIVAQELYDVLNQEFGLTLSAGNFGENLLVRGLGNLSQVLDKTYLWIGKGLVLRVSGQNNPCKNLMVYHTQLVKASYGRRGLLATVVGGVGEKIRAGDSIEILRLP